jgi:hypothetical protein
MEIVAYAKNVGAVLATVSTLAYVSGYLALRARAFTLGTDPAFTLVDEGYVFAGFRFVFVSLIILLLLSPIILAVCSGALWLYEHIPESFLNIGQWLLLVLLALVTLFFTVKVFSVNGVLLQQKFSGPNSPLQEAVMGGTLAIVLIFAVMLLTALSILWLKMRLSTANDAFTWVLGIVVAIQIFLLPIFHGALYADRKVRVLGATPAVVQGLMGPLGIVDRTSEHVALLGMDENNQRRLVTIKLDELNGIPVKKIVSLKEFVVTELASGEGKKELTMSEKAHSENTPAPTKTEDDKGFFEVLINNLQVTFEAIGSLGESVVDYGQIWSVVLDASGKPSKPSQIGTVTNLAWPVLGLKGKTIYAIQQDRIVQLSDDGQMVKVLDNQKQWIKLFGVTEIGAVLGMLYEDGESRLAILRTDGVIMLSPTPQSEEEQKHKLALMQESRSYSGNRSLYVERSKRGGRGFDVFYNTGDQVINLSDCGDDSCGQASLSRDFRRVLYVRKPRY